MVFLSSSGKEQDPFWSSLDLLAAAGCADPELSYLLLELSLQRSKPDMAPEEALDSVGTSLQGVEALFQAPSQEVRLRPGGDFECRPGTRLHDLARKLPEDELLFGKGWCHSSSRLARAELAEDNVTSSWVRQLP